MLIRRLKPADAAAFQALRLAGLQESPTSFGSCYAEEHDLPLAAIEERLASRADRGVFGAFNPQNELIGIVALGRENKQKLAHKALIWGLYVSPHARATGVARALLLEALALAQSVAEIWQINLSVHAENRAAIGLYESLNFIPFGREPNALYVNGKLHDEIHMCLHLSRA